jgi:hypothetical protein
MNKAFFLSLPLGQRFEMLLGRQPEIVTRAPGADSQANPFVAFQDKLSTSSLGVIRALTYFN